MLCPISQRPSSSQPMSSRRPLEAARDGGPEPAVALLDASGSAVVQPAPAPRPPARGGGPAPLAPQPATPEPTQDAGRLLLRGRLAIAGLLATGLIVTISAAHTQSFL